MRDRFRQGNNVQALRLAFLLLPSELAALMRAEPDDVARIEREDYQLTDEWVRSVARALGVPAAVVTEQGADIVRAKALSTGLAPLPTICPIAARFAILGLIAKFGGMRVASRVAPDDLGRVVQNFYAFIEKEPDATVSVSRLKPALQIAVLAFLQARDFEPGPSFESDLDIAVGGALAMIERFSTIPSPIAGRIGPG